MAKDYSDAIGMTDAGLVLFTEDLWRSTSHVLDLLRVTTVVLRPELARGGPGPSAGDAFRRRTRALSLDTAAVPPWRRSATARRELQAGGCAQHAPGGRAAAAVERNHLGAPR